MPITSSLGLMVFVDAMPSEQLSQEPDEVLCLTGVFLRSESGLSGLKQYKDYSAAERANEADNLETAISKGPLNLQASGTVARMKRVERYGQRILGKLPKVVAAGDHYVFDGTRLHRNNAIAAGWYAAALATIAASAAAWARNLNQQKVSLLVDKFPGVSEDTMKLLTKAVTQGEVRREWEVLRPHIQVRELYVDTLESFEEAGIRRSGKDHSHAILADWLSHSLYAQQNPANLLDGGAGRSEEYRTSIARPWNTIERMRLADMGKLREWM